MQTPAPSTPPVSPEALQQGLDRARRSLLGLGEVVSVLMRSPQHQGMPLASVRMLTPAIALGQYLTATAQDKNTGAASPVAVVIWANVSDELDRRFSGDGEQPSLQPADWKSGENAWLIAAAGEQALVQRLIATLQQNTLKGRPVKVRGVDAEGKPNVQTLKAPT